MSEPPASLMNSWIRMLAFSPMNASMTLSGYGFDLEWYAPFFELRFPHYGDLVTNNGIRTELRAAMEP